MQKSINISTKTILKVFAIPLIGYLVWENKDVVFSLFIAFIVMSALRPAVNYLQHSKGLKRTHATALVYVVFISVFSLLAGTIIPPIVYETTTFVRLFPDILSSIDPNILKSVRIQELSQYVPDLTNQIFSILGNVFSNTIFVVTTLVFGFYLLANEHLFVDLFGPYLSPTTLERVQRIIHKTESRLAAWFWGELTLMLAVGLLTYVGFVIMGLKYALPLAVLAGLLEALPNIGPTIAAVPAVLIGFTQFPAMGILALAWSFLVQQAENNILVPYIMRKAVGINPVVTLLCIFLGLRLAGPLGVLLAVPIYLCIEAIVLDPLKHSKNNPPQE